MNESQNIQYHLSDNDSIDEKELLTNSEMSNSNNLLKTNQCLKDNVINTIEKLAYKNCDKDSESKNQDLTKMDDTKTTAHHIVSNFLGHTDNLKYIPIRFKDKIDEYINLSELQKSNQAFKYLDIILLTYERISNISGDNLKSKVLESKSHTNYEAKYMRLRELVPYWVNKYKSDRN